MELDQYRWGTERGGGGDMAGAADREQTLQSFDGCVENFDLRLKKYWKTGVLCGRVTFNKIVLPYYREDI